MLQKHNANTTKDSLGGEQSRYFRLAKPITKTVQAIYQWSM